MHLDSKIILHATTTLHHDMAFYETTILIILFRIILILQQYTIHDLEHTLQNKNISFKIRMYHSHSE